MPASYYALPTSDNKDRLVGAIYRAESYENKVTSLNQQFADSDATKNWMINVQEKMPASSFSFDPNQVGQLASSYGMMQSSNLFALGLGTYGALNALNPQLMQSISKSWVGQTVLPPLITAGLSYQIGKTIKSQPVSMAASAAVGYMIGGPISAAVGAVASVFGGHSRKKAVRRAMEAQAEMVGKIVKENTINMEMLEQAEKSLLTQKNLLTEKLDILRDTFALEIKNIADAEEELLQLYGINSAHILSAFRSIIGEQKADMAATGTMNAGSDYFIYSKVEENALRNIQKLAQDVNAQENKLKNYAIKLGLEERSAEKEFELSFEKIGFEMEELGSRKKLVSANMKDLLASVSNNSYIPDYVRTQARTLIGLGNVIKYSSPQGGYGAIVSAFGAGGY